MSPSIAVCCPRCRGALADWACRRCELRFGRAGGTPVLLDPDGSVFAGAVAAERPSRWGRLLPRLSSNPVSARNFQRLRDLLLERSARPRALVVGGARLGVGAAKALADRRIEWVETDVALGPRTALIVDAHQIPFPDESFDAVVAQAVLEHVADPVAVAAELHRALKPGGLVYAETPFLQAVHAGAYDFTRWTPLGHRRLFRRFEEIDSGAAGGPGAALAWAWQAFLLSLAPRNGRRAATVMARMTAFWLPWLDRLLIERPAALDAASACYFLGVKAAAPLDDRTLLASYRGAQR